MHTRNPYLQPSLASSPAFSGFGQNANSGAMATAIESSAVMEGMRRMAAAVIQEIRNIYGIRLDRNEEAAWLTFDTAPLVVGSPGTNVRGIMSVGQEADFVATGIVCQVTESPVAAPPVLIPGEALRFQIIDGSTNRQLQRSSMPLSFLSVTGGAAGENPAGSRPYFLSKPRIFSRNSNVIWLLDNNAGVDAAVDIALFGYRIYDQDALDLTKAR
jgi:hypothetical protein